MAQVGAYDRGPLDNLSKVFPYAKPEEMKGYFESADLIIGHAGAGTIMEVLQLGKPLLVVVNSLLMQDHQTEVAVEFSKRGLLTMAHVSDLLETFESGTFEPKTIKMNTDWLIQSLETEFDFR